MRSYGYSSPEKKEPLRGVRFKNTQVIIIGVQQSIRSEQSKAVHDIRRFPEQEPKPGEQHARKVRAESEESKNAPVTPAERQSPCRTGRCTTIESRARHSQEEEEEEEEDGDDDDDDDDDCSGGGVDINNTQA
ncbi:hypothetical protein ANN_01031 [Periplaneta americana]|uniref:Uncharacterized protein n=1 Tax=Periplaneta americana TaxID=6978 RepID=A0ABQ8TUY0_PERAM|nr:hypothetical protein ANN_01031 [Periplaneta americana]